jgi:hemoglobin
MEPDAPHPWGSAATPYEELGGADRLHAMVDSFYVRMEADAPNVRVLHPANIATSNVKLYEYLSGWLGGPPLYENKRGHPQLRMRHLPFTIGEQEADDWMRCMRGAFDDCELEDPLRSFLEDRLDTLAHHMVNH